MCHVLSSIHCYLITRLTFSCCVCTCECAVFCILYTQSVLHLFQHILPLYSKPMLLVVFEFSKTCVCVFCKALLSKFTLVQKLSFFKVEI